MSRSNAEQRRRHEALDRSALIDVQLAKLNDMLTALRPVNRFYAQKLASVRLPLQSLDELATLPLTAKNELLLESLDHFGPANLTWPLERYVRFHQTSGTHGRPLEVYDTADDWQWWVECWQYVLDAAGVTAADRALLAFSFGPFIGFWSAHDALTSRGVMTIPGGGLNSLARLDLIERTKATVLLCTPTYALHLVEVAEEHKINLAHTSVQRIIVAGEPGGSIPAIRQRIEQAWSARVVDHSGSSEVGPWGYGDAAGAGLHVLETQFIPEFIGVESGESAKAGELSHLVLTSLGRWGMPIVRYRTGDLVRPVWSDEGPNRFVLLKGGVLGRADDMLIIRGVNIFPTAVEQILRSFPEVVEYRLTARKRGEMDELIVEVEDRAAEPVRIAEELRLRLGMRVDVRLAPPMSLPRFEGKGRRFVDQRR
ncbi:MAG: phenylacetate--CoA ligase family protein [Planctomycetales bacterium]|nr:phenylacetate--CoA ligase family protein [Planctomycetales bacterium]